MTDRKLTALALAVFVVVAALSGGATVAVFTDEESIDVNFNADVAGNTGTNDASDDTTSIEDDNDTTTDDNDTTTQTTSQTTETTTQTTETTTTETTTTTTTTTSAGNTEQNGSMVGLFVPTDVDLRVRVGSVDRPVGSILDHSGVVPGR